MKINLVDIGVYSNLPVVYRNKKNILDNLSNMRVTDNPDINGGILQITLYRFS